MDKVTPTTTTTSTLPTTTTTSTLPTTAAAAPSQADKTSGTTKTASGYTVTGASTESSSLFINQLHRLNFTRAQYVALMKSVGTIENKLTAALRNSFVDAEQVRRIQDRFFHHREEDFRELQVKVGNVWNAILKDGASAQTEEEVKSVEAYFASTQEAVTQTLNVGKSFLQHNTSSRQANEIVENTDPPIQGKPNDNIQ